MIRPLLLTAVLCMPLLANAQAIKCLDPKTGKTLYTDQPCKGGELVVPARTPDDVQRDADAAALAREDADRREQLALERARQQLQADQNAVALEYARAGQSQAESQACRAARAEASFRAASFAASEEEIRTARYNAALACGQQPPADIVVVQPSYPTYYPSHRTRNPYGNTDRPNRPASNPYATTTTRTFGKPITSTQFTRAPSRLDEPSGAVVIRNPKSSR
ncbi:hypothetical protein [Ottowia sp.]|uniref:hypothetical protein n=1 Tax=Ottowia sp. TaxID=1898956 RepID=UPI003A87AE5B